MKPYLFFPIFLLTLAPAWSSTTRAGARVPDAPSASPCDSVSDTPFAGEMVLFNVSVEGGGNTAFVAANDSFNISFDYYIQVCDSPASWNICQVVVGYATSPAPLFCIFRDRVECSGRLGTLTFNMKAPAFPSEYIIAFDLKRSFTELACPTTWPQGTPVHDRYLACVTVTAGNAPVAVTGGADNVTLSAATLHGTVNPSNAPTTVRFIYGASPGVYTDSVTAFESPINGTNALAVSGSAAGLSGNTRYYYRVSAESENGYGIGGEASFFTGPQFGLAEPVHAFGHLELNGSRTDSITVLNTGDMTMQITSVISLSGQYAVAPVSGSVGPLGAKKFAVTFSPPAYGRYNSGIAFIHGATTSPDTQYVRGDVPIGGVSAGWNLVSVPLTVADPRRSAVFPDAISNAFEFSSGYFSRDTLANGRGYWLKFPVTDSMVVTGDVYQTQTAAVSAGWNMIGGPSLHVPLDSVSTTPPGILAGNFFEYAAGYNPVSLLRPGKGYWVKVSQVGTITMKGALSGAGEASSFVPPAPEGYTELTVTDARGLSQRLFVAARGASAHSPVYLPPPPPGGAFDARFEGDLYAAAPDAGGNGVRLMISGARYPVTLSWTKGVEGMAVSVGGRTAPLDRPGSLLITGKEDPVTIGLTAGAGSAGMREPDGGLDGGYPNPFNPSTEIGYTVPSAGRVRIAVFNMLGEEVALLVDGVRGSGAHTVGFDAAGLPGGVYFCRMEGVGQVSTIKLLLVK